VDDSSADAPSTTAAKNAGTRVALLANELTRTDEPALAAESARLYADAEGAQKLDPALLIARGDEFLRQSDVTSARLFYKLAASNGSAAGATAMGSTYDPILLERNAVRGVKPEPGRALAWYKAAAELGDAGAKARSVQLLDALRRDAARGDPEAKAILDGPLP
jgi:TPR repeat protein